RSALHPFPTRRSSDLTVFNHPESVLVSSLMLLVAGVLFALYRPGALEEELKEQPVTLPPNDAASWQPRISRRLSLVLLGALVLRSEEHTSELQSPYDL